MTFDPGRVTTLTFDSYSTIVDVEAAEKALSERVPDPQPVSRLWRSRSLAYTFIANAVDAYKPFYEVNRDALQYALDAHGVDISTEDRDEILAVYHELDVFDDVREGMNRLYDAGYDLYVVSNGNPEMLDSMVDHAGIGGLVEDTVSADEIGTFKPDAELYRHAAARTGTPIDEIAHVTAGYFDVYGAMHAGMQGVWVNRDDGPWDAFAGDPDLTIGSFHDLVDELA
ncbi:haloacid dehalogenase type II [Haloarcula pellucida]|uniref:Haloacid dehalogenase n=1 Tax=Haloarcula pellucida TaxID=1427151 RepID=A0A830GG67_9EURY|nr:haloacid dehalogenase type II [Halomicroarcula pellucida]MBX0347107.1 haloacid dehalogenase type II [Halomicroarcula pellucida]GGN87023.1 haloacid dehalogenase [Halomicroarcula pellucida]